MLRFYYTRRHFLLCLLLSQQVSPAVNTTSLGKFLQYLHIEGITESTKSSGARGMKNTFVIISCPRES